MFELHQVKLNLLGYTPEICWQMDKMCCPHPQPKSDDSFCLSYPRLLWKSEILLRNLRKQHTNLILGSKINSDKVPWFQTKYFDAAKLISGTTVLGRAIMDMSGAILLWQRLCNGEPRPDMTIGRDTAKSTHRQNNILLFILWQRGGIYVEEMTWKWLW